MRIISSGEWEFYSPLRTLWFPCAMRKCSSQESIEVSTHWCTNRLLVTCVANQSRAEYGQDSAASQTRWSTNWVKHGRLDGPADVWLLLSVSKVNNLKNGWHDCKKKEQFTFWFVLFRRTIFKLQLLGTFFLDTQCQIPWLSMARLLFWFHFMGYFMELPPQ